jgi:hypothetical protein
MPDIAEEAQRRRANSRSQMLLAMLLCSGVMLSRRAVLQLAPATVLPFSALSPGPAIAATGEDPRAALLVLLATSPANDDPAVAAAVEKLVPLDPSRGAAATSAALGGRWRLVWSANADAFSPLLDLPPQLRPESLQLLGSTAEAAGCGAGRIAQVLDFPLPFLPVLRLSSSARPDPDDARTLEILPPFRLETLPGDSGGSGGGRTLAESGSDAGFRAMNARTAEAQAAPRNRYEISYLEESGRPGALSKMECKMEWMSCGMEDGRVIEQVRKAFRKCPHGRPAHPPPTSHLTPFLLLPPAQATSGSHVWWRVIPSSWALSFCTRGCEQNVVNMRL